MRYLMILIASFLLAACASAPSPVTGVASGGTVAAATLAPWGSFEMELAPGYTANTMLRLQAASALRAGRIPLDTARGVLAATDAARTALDGARALHAVGQPDAARTQLAAAHRHLADARNILEPAQ